MNLGEGFNVKKLFSMKRKWNGVFNDKQWETMLLQNVIYRTD